MEADSFLIRIKLHVETMLNIIGVVKNNKS
jgi:hypothetical protein